MTVRTSQGVNIQRIVYNRRTGTATLWSTSTNPYWYKYNQHQDTIRRVKPQSSDLLFNGTSVAHMKDDCSRQVCYVDQDQYTWWQVPPDDMFIVTLRDLGIDTGAGYIVSKLVNKVKDQNVNLGNALGEYRQTAHMFSDITKRVVSSYRSIRKGNLAKALSILRGSPSYRRTNSLAYPGIQMVGIKPKRLSKAANNWLEWTYGVSPLISDLQGSLKELSLAGGKSLLRRVSSKQGCEKQTTVSFNSLYSYDKTKGSVVTFNSHNYTGVLWYEVDLALVREVASLGFLNPLGVLWEITPYSFVADWFINVGEWLSQIDAPYGLRRVGYTLTQRSVFRSDYYFKSSHSYYERQRYSRTFSTSIPAIKLQWQPSLSWRRIVSGLSLLRQKF